MVQKRKIAKRIYDASWYELIRQIEYKSRWMGKEFYQIDTYYPSSQIYSRCGYKNKGVKDVRVREWECPSCTSKNERDINASINIMFEGVKKYIERMELQSL